MFHKLDEPLLAHRVEERADVGVQYPIHLCAGDPDQERIHRIVRAASGPKPIREPEEIFLVDRAQHRSRGPLDDLVQYFEMLGNRAIYNDGWVACSRFGVPWNLVGREGDLLGAPWEL